MTERPILFSAPMIRAILDGRKTQTRRVLKPQPPAAAKYAGIHHASDEPDSWFFNSPSGPFKVRETRAAGDTLWVREAWSHTGSGVWSVRDALSSHGMGIGHPIYRADGEIAGGRWFPSIHLPRIFSRINLIVTDVRVQRLQEISEDDARAEGVERMKSGRGYYSIKHGHAAVHFGVYHDYAKEAFVELWTSINGAGSWDANPWVYALTFERKSAG